MMATRRDEAVPRRLPSESRQFNDASTSPARYVCRRFIEIPLALSQPREKSIPYREPQDIASRDDALRYSVLLRSEMKLYHFRSYHPNFGDELNPWLMPKVFPNFFDEDDSDTMLAIGSILFNDHPAHWNKIVFGSGYGGYSPPPKLDETWKVYCVRGPRSAKVCGLDADAVAGDAAILMARHWRCEAPKTIRVSFMPHYESIGRGHWQKVCKLAGIHFLNPRLPVEQVLDEICRSEVVITEAMHGAIVSDALRVPWVAITPLDATHRMKWFDWAEALDISLRPHALPPSSVREARLARTKKDDWFNAPKGLVRLAVRAADVPFIAAATAALSRARRIEPQLSSDAALDRVLDKLQTNAERILADYRPAH